MEKFGGTRYNSQWDGSTWFILGLVVVCCAVPYFLDDGIWPTIICIVMLAFVLVTFLSIYYRINGDILVGKVGADCPLSAGQCDPFRRNKIDPRRRNKNAPCRNTPQGIFL